VGQAVTLTAKLAAKFASPGAQHHCGSSTQTVQGRDDNRRSRSIGSCPDALSPKCHQLDSCILAI